MRYTMNAINILVALECKGIGPAWINKNIKWKQDLRTIWEMIRYFSKDFELTFGQFQQKRDGLEQLLENEFDIDGVVALGDTDFPVISDAVKGSERPVVLFYRGDISLLNRIDKNVAVIGVLNPENSIEERERAFVSALVKSGCNIISGLAKGCDSISHKQTLDTNGKTIAILPSTIKNILPVENKSLSDEIVSKNGLLVTEYYKEVSSKNQLIDRYIKRDRLQAMFCKAICLVASYAPNNQGNDCGSRHAMGKAKEYNIQRYVMYNQNTDFNNPQFDLNRNLLKEGDVRVLSAKSIMEICNMGIKETTLFNF